MGMILPLLLQKGVQSSVGEVRTLSVDIVAKIAKAAGPDPLKPILSDLIYLMLESLSGLESAQLNYLEQHAEGEPTCITRLSLVLAQGFFVRN